MENHIESCHCWECGGYGKKEYTEAAPDPIRGGDLVGVVEECDSCEGVGELLRAKITQTTVIRAFLTQAKNALEDIDLIDSDLDLAYGRIDDVIGDIENYERKVGTRNEN
tara:strand:- start:679 stop:1008 length:330 start_codon:yes stop_codon:yes gene_type:complete